MLVLHYFKISCLRFLYCARNILPTDLSVRASFSFAGIHLLNSVLRPVIFSSMQLEQFFKCCFVYTKEIQFGFIRIKAVKKRLEQSMCLPLH